MRAVHNNAVLISVASHRGVPKPSTPSLPKTILTGGVDPNSDAIHAAFSHGMGLLLHHLIQPQRLDWRTLFIALGGIFRASAVGHPCEVLALVDQFVPSALFHHAPLVQNIDPLARLDSA